MTDETEETTEPETKEEAPKPVVYKIPREHMQTLRLIATLRQQGAAPLIEQLRAIEGQIQNVFAGAAGEMSKLVKTLSPAAELPPGCSYLPDLKAGTITVTPPSASTEGPQDPA